MDNKTTQSTEPVKRGRGRPKGSLGKKKKEVLAKALAEVTETIEI